MADEKEYGKDVVPVEEEKKDVTLDFKRSYEAVALKLSNALLETKNQKDNIDFYLKMSNDCDYKMVEKASECIENLGELLALVTRKKEQFD